VASLLCVESLEIPIFNVCVCINYQSVMANFFVRWIVYNEEDYHL